MQDQNHSNPNVPAGYQRIEHSERPHPANHTRSEAVASGESVTATLILRRKPGATPPTMEHFTRTARSERRHYSREEFAETMGAAQEELDAVSAFARSQGLEVLESHRSRRSVVVRGTVEQIDKAFAVELHHYQGPRHKYRGFEGAVHMPVSIAGMVESVIGLDNRPVPARRGAADPSNTGSLTPQQVAQLYSFPAGTGAGQTIGIYEMVTFDQNNNPQNPGFAASDIAATIQAFGGGLAVPQPISIAINGQQNTGVSDPETILDITVAGAIAQEATLAVYFVGSDNMGIVNGLQRMIHPSSGDPVPTVISISYGWGPDDDTQFTSSGEFNQIDQLFQDAAQLDITVLVSSGDSGAKYLDPNQAQASFPATDPFVTACGGTTIGNINGSSFDEFVWNDTFGPNSGATGGGISARFPVPAYQAGITLPTRINTGTVGRGMPDIAGNASPNSGYPQVVGGGDPESGGGTSAVAPLYAALIAVINANLGTPAGFLNPTLYAMAQTAFNDTLGSPGPANNSFDGVTGYPAGPGWDACTGLGSLNGTALQTALGAAMHAAPVAP